MQNGQYYDAKSNILSPREFRKFFNIGIGLGIEQRVSTRGYVSIDLNNGENSQIHIQHGYGSGLKKTTSLVTVRKFLADSEIFLGLGGGRNIYSKSINGNNLSFQMYGEDISAFIEVGGQFYRKTWKDAFYYLMSFGFYYRLSYQDDFDGQNERKSFYNNFENQTNNKDIHLLTGIGMFF